MASLLMVGVFALAIWLLLRARGTSSNDHPSADLSMLPERFVVFDLETTGLDCERHEIIEIGAIRVNRDSSSHDTFTTLIKPRGRVSSKITQLTGLDRATLSSDGIEIGQALTEFREFVGDLPLIAFNLDFDHAFLLEECRRANMPTFPNRFDCALKMAREAWPNLRSYKLTSLCSGAGIEVVAEHRALPDCERALRVYVAAVQQLGRCNIGAVPTR